MTKNGARKQDNFFFSKKKEKRLFPDQVPGTTGVSVGHVTHDQCVISLSSGVSRSVDIRPGGCAYYAAKAWKYLGAKTRGGKVRLLTSLGRDFGFCGSLESIEVGGRGALHTTTFQNFYSPMLARQQWVSSQASPVSISWVQPSFCTCDFLFLAPVLGEVSLEEWVWRVRPWAKIIGVGLQGFLKEVQKNQDSKKAGKVVPRQRPGADNVSKGSALRTISQLVELLRPVDVVFLSEEDLEGQPTNILEELRACVSLVVLTRGKMGSDLFFGRQFFRVGVYETPCVKDPTGAGDTYAAAFLMAMSWGVPAVTAARFGAAASSVVIEGQADETCQRLLETFQRYQQVPVISRKKSTPVREKAEKLREKEREVVSFL